MTPRLWVEAPDLAPLLGEPGPFLSVVLATEAAVENASQRNQLRWRGVRDGLAGEGADEAALAHVDPLVEDAHLSGETLVVVANAAGAHHVSHWPRPPFRELARWDSLPALGAILERRQESPPHLVVVADRQGADVTAVMAEGEEVKAEAADPEHTLRKVQAGGWSHRRYQQRAEASWDQNAKDVAELVTRLAHRAEARFVAVAGDVRALQLLREHLPPEVAELVCEVGGSRWADGAPDARQADLDALVAEITARDTQALLDKLAEELGQHDRACSGAADTMAALSAAKVQVLLVHDDPDDTRRAWCGSEPSVVATSAEELDGVVTDVREGRLSDALIRAALATGAGVRMLASDREVAEGVGAILRW